MGGGVRFVLMGISTICCLEKANDLRLFIVFFCFLFLLVSGKGYWLVVVHSLDFFLTFFCFMIVAFLGIFTYFYEGCRKQGSSVFHLLTLFEPGHNISPCEDSDQPAHPCNLISLRRAPSVTYKIAYASCEDSDQPAHPRRLIWVFAGRSIVR